MVHAMLKKSSGFWSLKYKSQSAVTNAAADSSAQLKLLLALLINKCFVNVLTNAVRPMFFFCVQDVTVTFIMQLHQN